MLSFASKLVRSIEHSAETIISGDNQLNDAYFSQSSGHSHGFRILNVINNSIGDSLGLQSWFDFIIGINGHEIPTNYTDNHQLIPNYNYFIQEISRSSNIEFTIWSAKGGTIRKIIIPIKKLTNDDSTLQNIPISSNNDNNNNTLLEQNLFEKIGISLQWTQLISSTYVYHVLQIHPNSPAQKAGLIEHSDFIIGAQDGLLATGGEDLLGRLINSKKNQNLELYVYNQDFDIVRPVNIIPVDNWGGIGFLGAGVGYGILHRLPIPSLNEPGSILFQNDEQDNNNNYQFEPINKDINPPTFINNNINNNNNNNNNLAPPVHGRKKKPTNHSNTELLDFLQQEGERSRKLETVHIEHDNSLPPPPRK